MSSETCSIVTLSPSTASVGATVDFRTTPHEYRGDSLKPQIGHNIGPQAPIQHPTSMDIK